MCNSCSPIYLTLAQKISEYILLLLYSVLDQKCFDVGPASPATDSDPIFHFDTDPDPVRLQI
jgi:hypothetical protein